MSSKVLALASLLREREGWRAVSAHFERSRSMDLEGRRHRITARFSAFFEGMPAPALVVGIHSPRRSSRFSPGSLATWPDKGTSRCSPLTKKAKQLAEAGFRRVEPTYFHRWRPDLTKRATLEEIAFVESTVSLL